MTKLFVTKRRIFSNLFILSLIFAAQIVNTSFTQSTYYSYTYEDISNEDLIEQIKISTSDLSSLFNEELGIFVWNVQDPLNLSRYGDFTDLSNAEEGLASLDVQQLLDGLAQDILMQFLVLENNVQIALEFVGSEEEEHLFNREWIFMTEKIISWLYYRVASYDQLISILNLLTNNNDGFESYWNTLIRSKYNTYLGKRIALLPDTLVLGSKILRAVEFLPYFTFQEQYSILLLSEVISSWWNKINQYALYDPKFAIAGMGEPKIEMDNNKFTGWQDFALLSRNGTFAPANIYTDDYLDFQNKIYTSPQIANEYMTFIRKASAGDSIIWQEDHSTTFPITSPLLESTFYRIITDYANHISWIENQVQYIIDPGTENSRTPLDKRYSGYSFVWSEYFVDGQDSNSDLNNYRIDQSSLKLINMRTFQGAGDIRGLMDIYGVLSQGFIYDSSIQIYEEKASLILNEILKSQRIDKSFIFSPYFGTALNRDIIATPLINDADLIIPYILPDGLKRFTGSMTVLDFLLDTRTDYDRFGSYKDETKQLELNALTTTLDETLGSLGELLLSNINSKTLGIPKQSIIGNRTVGVLDTCYFEIKRIKLTINLAGIVIPYNELPDWIYNYDIYTKTGRTNVYQWEYLFLLERLFTLTDDTKYLDPIFESYLNFNQDYLDDQQYQLASICEGKDAIVRTFFEETFVVDSIELTDTTGLFENLIPYDYRCDTLAVTNAFAVETPQRIISVILSILPNLLAPILSNPINQIVLIGFISGIIMTVAVIYYKRPKHQ